MNGFPKKPPMNGVRNVKFSLATTLIWLPAPAPAEDVEQAMVVPAASTQLVVVVTVPSPRCAWEFVSSRAFARIAVLSVGAVAA